MDNITKNNLELNLKEATFDLLEMARKSCWNKISDNTCYIISEIVEDDYTFTERQLARKKANDKKNN